MRSITCFFVLATVLSCNPPEMTGGTDCKQDPTICNKTPGTKCDEVTLTCLPTGCPTCEGATPFCDSDLKQCVATCADDIDCAMTDATKPSCFKTQGQTRGTCVSCVASTQCTDSKNPVCDPVAHQCAKCTQDSECGTDGYCVKEADCPAIPIPGKVVGECIRAADFTRVDSDNTKCSATGAGGKPYCSITEAAKQGSLIRVAGGSYPAFTHATGNLVIVGPGRGANPPAQFDQLNVTGGSLLVAGIQVSTSTQPNAVSCTGSSSNLAILESVILNTASRGINATNCSKICVERSRLTTQRFGINLDGSSSALSYRIVNVAATGGGSGVEAYAVLLGDGTSGYFAFNTITRYASGVQCTSGSTNLDSSIILGNGSPQVTGCNTAGRNTVTTGMADLALGNEPTLNTTGTNNPACCIDKVTTPLGVGPVPIVDYFGKKRPNGPMPLRYDIGFHEIQPVQ